MENEERGRSRAGKSLPILLIACGLVALAAGLGAGLFMVRRAHASPAHPEKANKPVEIGTVYSLGEMVVNLADTATMRYAKVSVALGFIEKVPDEKLKEDLPVLRDIVISVLIRKSFNQLHRRGGMESLKKEILAAASHRYHAATVAKVYLDAFAMQ